MSSILLLLEDGEMHPFVPGSSAGQIVLSSRGGDDEDGAAATESGVTYTDAVITSVGGDSVVGETLTLGSHFLTAEDLGGAKDADGNVVTKIEVENVPLEVVVEKTESPSKKKNTAKASKSVGASLSAAERKVCLWPTGNGSTCGKTFTKFDSLKRHLSEAHKGLRPFACTLCDKSYGRRDYLQRHLKSHNASYAVNLAGSGSTAAAASSAAVVKKVHLAGGQTQNIVLQVQQPQNVSGGTVQIIPASSPDHAVGLASPTSSTGGAISDSTPSTQIRHIRTVSSSSAGQQGQSQPLNAPNPIPFFSISGQLPTAKPMGSKICRWVQNDGTVCGKAFSKLDSLRRHVNELHKGVRPHACDLCEKSYGRKDYLERHMRTHEKKAKAEAAAAAAAAGDNSSGGIDWGPNSGVLLSGDEVTPPPAPPEPKVIKKKRKDIPPEEKKICLWILDDGTACGKTFTKFDSLKRHVSEAHKNIRPYSCSLCGKTYGRRDYLLRHLKSHSDIESTNITIPKVRNNPSNHPDNQLNLLNTSSSSSTASSSVTVSTGLPQINFGAMVPTPLTTVTAPAAPVVRIAGSSGGVTSGISAKRRALEDKKTCKWMLENGSVCGKTFSKFDSLRRHVAELHKNIRPYVCELCQKSYGRKDYLDRHMRSHLAENMSNAASTTTTTTTTTTTIVSEDGITLDHIGVAVDSDEDEDDSVTISDEIKLEEKPPKMEVDPPPEDEEEAMETTTTTVVVDASDRTLRTNTGDDEDDSSEVILPGVVTVVSND